MSARKVGRPRLDHATTPSAPVHLKLPSAVYDQASKAAHTRRETVQDLIRRGLTRLLKDESGG